MLIKSQTYGDLSSFALLNPRDDRMLVENEKKGAALKYNKNLRRALLSFHDYDVVIPMEHCD